MDASWEAEDHPTKDDTEAQHSCVLPKVRQGGRTTSNNKDKEQEEQFKEAISESKEEEGAMAELEL
jgi:hypothetical protein